MNVQAGKDWATLIAGVIAALIGLIKLYQLVRGTSDKFDLGSGTVSPAIYREDMLHVISRSSHPITLADWGFIEADGKFSSIPMDWEADPSFGEDLVSNGSSKLAARGDRFETGYVRRDPSIGVFARTVMQKRPRVAFDSSAPRWRRAWIRVRLFFQPNHFLW